ncbi:MAG: ribosome recycling factor [bacterium]|nr:ribosome recycling factor [bacterium]
MEDLKQKGNHIIEHLKLEIVSLRTGRATPAMVEDLEVDYYGSKTPLKALAAIGNPEPRTLTIQPWDKGAMQAIEKAIQMSPLGINPVADRDLIRLSIPSLTEERRKELVKLLGRFVEDARITVRKEREDSLRGVDAQFKSKEISEDGRFRHRADIQKVVDELNKKIEDIAAAKEKEIMGV